MKRNVDRFPEDFMFQLNNSEAEQLVSQNVIPSKVSLGGYLPYVFTQEGVAIVIMETLRKLLKESKGKAAAQGKKIGFDTIPQ